MPNSACGDYTPLFGPRNDLRVRLTGLGGDEWFSSTYTAYADLLSQFRIVGLIRKLQSDRHQPSGFAPFPGYARALAQYGVLPLIPDSLKSTIRRRRPPPKVHAIVDPAFAARTRLAERLSWRQKTPRCRTFVQQKMYRCYSAGPLSYALEMDARWTSGFRMEGRNPFLDRRILEFAYAIPDSQRFRPGLSKFVMRNAMRGILPERLRMRTDKADLTELHPRAMTALGGERLFDNLNVVKHGWVNGTVVRESYRSMADAFSRGDDSYMDNVNELWKVFALELWLSVVFPGIKEPFSQVTETMRAAL